ncbi:hypothetical protein [Methylobacterium nonmethylotrophicum]|uniref:Uncharacterized protein n=1 Tax=Methylobacterium nonmethylotrophicum TaxID=1141884 RepID=A0A4Z0NG30_9HYPH|nr:hypothetical protein [Methylobacterium nonmethylotrophicum]TGD94708.1 hypothetical protein EU555_31250 [Methylobacterium nonmethylotrophicum]
MSHDTNRTRVAKLLRDEWDPIGEGLIPDLPHDEYVHSAELAYAVMTQTQGGDAAVAACLLRVATEDMALPDSDRLRARCDRAARLLGAMALEFGAR